VKLKALILSSLMTLLSAPAFAQFFPGQTFVTVLPGQVAVQVVNPFYQPIICSGQVFGQTINGALLNAFFIEQILTVGSSKYAVVQTNAFMPFVGGWANINCRYIGF
jgi:hypothetical protein